MRYLTLTFLVFVLFALQTPILHQLDVSSYAVDVALLACIYLAATSTPLAGFVTSVAIGLLADSFTPGGILGMNMEIHGLLYLMSLGLTARFQLLRPLALMVVVLVCSITKTLLFFLFSVLFDRNFTQYTASLLGAIPHALVTTLLAPVVFLLFGAVDRGLRGRRKQTEMLR